jgi:hypothetical protein
MVEMLWALLALYFFGYAGAAGVADGLEHAKTFIKTDIEDKARKTELLSIVEDAERTTKEYVKAGGKAVKELSDLSEKHDTRLEEFQPVLEKFRADATAFQDRMIRHRFDLKAKMSREEWSRVFPKEEPSPEQKAVQPGSGS